MGEPEKENTHTPKPYPEPQIQLHTQNPFHHIPHNNGPSPAILGQNFQLPQVDLHRHQSLLQARSHSHSQAQSHPGTRCP